MQGYGIYRHSNKDIYEGEFHHNVKCGSGIMKYCNRDVYEGTWKNNLRNGYGNKYNHQ